MGSFQEKYNDPKFVQLPGTCVETLYVLQFNFNLSLKFIFSLFWGLVMYDNELKPSKLKFKPKVKLNDNKYNRFPSLLATRTSRGERNVHSGEELARRDGCVRRLVVWRVFFMRQLTVNSFCSYTQHVLAWCLLKYGLSRIKTEYCRSTLSKKCTHFCHGNVEMERKIFFSKGREPGSPLISLFKFIYLLLFLSIQRTRYFTRLKLQCRFY